MQFEPLAPVPAVTLARQLRQIPLFRFASVDELFRISAISRQVRYESGSTVQKKGGPATYIQVLVEGSFELQNGERDGKLVEPPAMLGFQEVLEGTTILSGARARSESIALVMPAEEFRTLLSANIELAQGLFRILLEQNQAGGPSKSAVSSNPGSTSLSPEPLKTVEKLLYLQTVPALARATAEELYEVAAITREASFAVDDVLFSEGHPPSIWLVLSGEIRLEPSAGGNGVTVGPGECVGANETLAGNDWAWRARATAPGRALRIDREALHDLLADHMDLLQGIFGAIFSAGGRVSEHEPHEANGQRTI